MSTRTHKRGLNEAIKVMKSDLDQLAQQKKRKLTKSKNQNSVVNEGKLDRENIDKHISDNCKDHEMDCKEIKLRMMKDKPSNSQSSFRLPSCSPFSEEIGQIENSLEQIVEVIFPENGFFFYPPSRTSSLGEKRIQEIYRQTVGVAYCVPSLRRLLDLEDVSRKPDDIISDILVLTTSKPAMVFSLTKESTTDMVRQYNRSLAREITYKMRDFTDEHFNIFCMIITETESVDSLTNKIETVISTKRQYLPESRFSMSEHKFKGLLRAFTTAVATTDVSSLLTTEKQERQHQRKLCMLTKDQFTSLNENMTQQCKLG